MSRYIIITVLYVALLQEFGGSHPTPFELLDKYAETQEKLRSVVIEAHDRSVSNSGANERFGLTVLATDGTRVNIKQQAATESFTSESDVYRRWLYDGKGVFTYSRGSGRPKGDTITLAINDPMINPQEWIAIAYGGAALRGFFYGDGPDYRVNRVVRKATKLVVRPKTENVNGSQCYVIDAITERGDYTLWIDPRHGYHIAKAQVRRNEGDLVHPDLRLRPGLSLSASIRDVRFDKIDGVWVPVEASMTTGQRNRQGGFSNRRYHRITKIRINPGHDALGSFAPTDIRSGARAYITTYVNESGSLRRCRWIDNKIVNENDQVVWRHSVDRAAAFELLQKYAANQNKLKSLIAKTEEIITSKWSDQEKPSSERYVTELLGPAVKTDSKGRFMMKVLAGPGFDFQYRTFVVARKSGLAYAWDGLNYSFIEKAEGNFNLILEKPGVLSGRLLEADGSPVAGAKVRAAPKNHYLSRLRQRPILGPEEWFTAKTDAQGNFTFDYFAPDVSVDFMVEAPGRSLVHQLTTCYLESCGYEVDRAQVQLVLPPKTTVQGRVVDGQTGAGVSGVPLMLQIYSLPQNEHLYYHYQFKSGEGGNFSIEAVPPGRHILRVVTPRHETGDWIGKNTLISIGPKDSSKTVTVRVEKGGLIRVLVRDRKTRQPLSGIHLSLRNKQFTGFAKDWGFYRSGWPGTDGIALIRCPAGRCEVRASRPDYHGSNPMTVTVRKNETSTKEIYLEKKSRVTGMVTDESSRPVEGVFVAVHPHGDEAFTDSSGSFALKPEMGGRKPEVLFARRIDRNLAAAVRIQDPAKPLRVILKPAVSIVGQVTDTAGKGIPAARVSLTTNVSNASSKFTEVIADEKGSYEIKAIAPEKSGFGYRISVAASGYGMKGNKKISVVGSSYGSVKIPTIALPPADVSVSGQVVYADGSPAARAPIFLGHRPDVPQPSRTTATDENGRFVINRVCKGPIRLQANFDSSPGGSGSLEAEGGDQGLKIVLGKEGVQTKLVSLLGKPLPNLTEFGLRSASALAGGKQILVCFWDVNQRPSRNCVQQLSRGARLFARKNVHVVLVQTPAVPDRMIVDWLRRNRVTFSPGRARTGPEGLSKTWGVQSLPWLILTDSKHVVTAEGFGLNELNKKIMEAENAKR